MDDEALHVAYAAYQARMARDAVTWKPIAWIACDIVMPIECVPRPLPMPFTPTALPWHAPEDVDIIA